MKVFLFIIFSLMNLAIAKAQNCNIKEVSHKIEQDILSIQSSKLELQSGLEKGSLNEEDKLKLLGPRYIQIKKNEYLVELESKKDSGKDVIPADCLPLNEELEEKYAQFKSLNQELTQLRIKYLKNELALNSSTPLDEVKEVNLEFEQEKIDELKKEIQQKKEDLELTVEESKKKEGSHETVYEKNFALIKKSLSMIKIDIVDYKLNLLTEISTTYEEFSQRFQANNLLMKEIKANSSLDYEKNFLNVTSQWKEVIKENFYALFTPNKLFAVPNLDRSKLNMEDLSQEQKISN